MKESLGRQLSAKIESDEQVFHKERWERAARQDELRGAIQRYLDKNSPDRSPEDFMMEEAERELNDVNKRLSVEYHKWDARLKPMLQHIMATPEGAENRDTLLLVLGGGMRGVYGVGQVLALQHAGIPTSRFKVVGGVSAGTGPAAFYASGHPERAASLYMNECTTKKFFDIKRFNKILDTEFIAEKMRSGAKALDTEAIQESTTELFAIAKNEKTGKSELIDMKTAKPDIVATTEASSAIPLFRPSVEVNGEKYIDGAFNAIPLDEIIATYSPKNILILANEPFDYMSTRSYTKKDKSILWLAGNTGSVSSMATLEAVFKSKGHFRELLEEIEREKHVKIAVMYPPDCNIGPLTNDADSMATAIVATARATYKELGIKQPDSIPLMDSLNVVKDSGEDDITAIAA